MTPADLVTSPELAVLGAILTKPACLAEVLGIIKLEDVLHEKARTVLSAMVVLDEERQPIDTMTVWAKLVELGTKDKAGVLAFLGMLDLYTPYAANVVAYAKLVADSAARRRLVVVLAEQLAKAKAEVGTVADVIRSTENALLALAPDADRGPRHINDVIGEALPLIDERQRAPNGVSGLPTGLADLDRKLGGLQPESLYLAAARTGVGKTLLAMQVVTHVGVECGKTVLVFSLEMKDVELVIRAIGASAEVSLDRLSGREKITDVDFTQINDTAARLGHSNIWISDAPVQDLSKMRAAATRVKNKHGLALVVVDYLQLVSGSVGRNANREQEVAQISRGLKILSKELGVPVLALAQVNRKGADDGDPPTLSSLRESGSLEQDADAVIFIHPVPQEEGAAASVLVPVDLIAAKVRNGTPGPVSVMLRKDIGRFVNAAGQLALVAPPEREPPRDEDFLPLPSQRRQRTDFTKNPEEQDT